MKPVENVSNLQKYKMINAYHIKVGNHFSGCLYRGTARTTFVRIPDGMYILDHPITRWIHRFSLYDFPTITECEEWTP